MEKKENCDTCSMRKKHDTNPKSLMGRFWRWHINFCPGWKKYIASLDEENREAIFKQYNLKKR